MFPAQPNSDPFKLNGRRQLCGANSVMFRSSCSGSTRAPKGAVLKEFWFIIWAKLHHGENSFWPCLAASSHGLLRAFANFSLKPMASNRGLPGLIAWTGAAISLGCVRVCVRASEGFTSPCHSLGNTLWALVSACGAVNEVFCLHATLTPIATDESEDGILN